MNRFPRMHVSLYVHSIAETVNFYTTFFGKSASKVKADYAKYELDEPSLIISFVQNSDRVQQNFGHLGFQVDSLEKLTTLLNDAKHKGLEVLEEMGTNCCYANQDKFWVKDPNGVQWEVYYFHEDVAFNDPHYASTDENVACCTPEVALQEAKKEKPRIKMVDLQNGSCAPGSGCC